MSGILPASRPKISHLEALNILGGHGVHTPLAFLAIRGFLDEDGKNQRRMYDDLIALVGPQLILIMNGNTDPNGYRPGHGSSEATKGMASLKEGVWLMQKGSHKGKYPAFVQAQDFTVYRDADGSEPAEKIKLLDGRKVYEDTGDFVIHFHYAWDSTTSSLGCQTVPQEQYEPMRDLVYKLMSQQGAHTIPYCLIHA